MNSTPDADRYAALKLTLSCKICGSKKLVPWQQLGGNLYCNCCRSWYRVERMELVETAAPDHFNVQVRGSLSSWKDHQAIAVHRPTSSERLKDWATDGAKSPRFFIPAGCLAMLLLTATIVAVMRAPTSPAPLVIPKTLEARAELFAASLARRDHEIMVVLTDPRLHKALRLWLGHAKDLPEASGARSAAGSTAAEAPSIETSFLHVSGLPETPELATVQVKVTTPLGEKTLEQRWEKFVGVWYFQPPELHAPAPPRGPKAPHARRG